MKQFSKRNILISSFGAFVASSIFASCTIKTVSNTKTLLAELEKKHGGRIGVCIRNTQTNEVISYRGDERFALCSTFKMPLAAMILREIEQGRMSATQEVAINQNGLKILSPLVRDKLAIGKMQLIDLAMVIQLHSDNIAANALLVLIGGPKGYTNSIRELGDNITNIERIEPEMNTVLPGETRDTTSPNAFAQTVQKILLGGYLNPASTQTLINWMIDTKTGSKRIRAGLPNNWRAGDKTGTGIDENLPNRYNDVVICWPPDKAPYIITAYYEGPGFFDDMREIDLEVLSTIGRIAAQEIMSQ